MGAVFGIAGVIIALITLGVLVVKELSKLF